MTRIGQLLKLIEALNEDYNPGFPYDHENKYHLPGQIFHQHLKHGRPSKPVAKTGSDPNDFLGGGGMGGPMGGPMDGPMGGPEDDFGMGGEPGPEMPDGNSIEDLDAQLSGQENPEEEPEENPDEDFSYPGSLTPPYTG